MAWNLSSIHVGCVFSESAMPSPIFSSPVHTYHTLKAHTSLVTAENVECSTQSWGQQIQPAIGMRISREAFLHCEKAQIISAAERAMALAKAAVKAAKDAAALADQSSLKSADMHALSSEVEFQRHKNLIFPESLSFEKMKPLTEEQITSQVQNLHASGNFSISDLVTSAEKTFQGSFSDEDDTHTGILEKQHNAAVKSTRQFDRQAKRERASKNAEAEVSNVLFDSDCESEKQGKKYSDQSQGKLLTASEEAILSEGVQDLLNLERIKVEYKNKMGNEPTMAQWAEAVGIDRFSLTKRLAEGQRCKSKMVSSNMRLVVSIAVKYQKFGMTLPDLVQAGCTGLMRGIEKFDANRGVRFSTYAHWWIRQAIKKTLTQHAKTVSVPASVQQAASKIRSAKSLFQGRHHRNPSLNDLAGMTGLTASRVKDVMAYSKSVISLDSPMGGEEDSYYANVLSDPDQISTEASVTTECGEEDVNKILSILTPKERALVRLRYGLDDGLPKSLQEVGEILSLSRERVRQMECIAMKKLKKIGNLGGLEHYLKT